MNRSIISIEILHNLFVELIRLFLIIIVINYLRCLLLIHISIRQVSHIVRKLVSCFLIHLLFIFGHFIFYFFFISCHI